MENFESLSHVRWECKYNIVFIADFRGAKFDDTCWR
jgi:hypothetical protein